ncbi:MAG: hypothetical protein LBI60_04370 [Bacteroidales bacterium]|jgi:hypothetical protein|nr:hypothetical protein [Bacteroidales bacterium]
MDTVKLTRVWGIVLTSPLQETSNEEIKQNIQIIFTDKYFIQQRFSYFLFKTEKGKINCSFHRKESILLKNNNTLKTPSHPFFEWGQTDVTDIPWYTNYLTLIHSKKTIKFIDDHTMELYNANHSVILCFVNRTWFEEHYFEFDTWYSGYVLSKCAL